MNTKQLKIFINNYRFLKLLKNYIKKIIIYIKNKKNRIGITKTEKLLTKLKQNGKIKLNLGCCNKKITGWINIDIDKSVNPDIIDDVIILAKFKDNSADEIKSAHLMEHLLKEDGINAVKTWFRVLCPGGVLSIECPNLDKCISMIQSKDSEEVRLEYMEILLKLGNRLNFTRISMDGALKL